MLKSVYKYAILPYTLVMLYFMFFGMGRSQYVYNEIRIIPAFSTYKFLKEADYYSEALFIVFANLVMFIPYGFLKWIFPRFQNLKFLLINFVAVIIVLETLQYFSRMGVFDIDDVIINTIGVYLGYQLCKVFETRISRLVL